MSQLPENMFDVRHIERFLAEGKVSADQYKAYLDSLEDCGENMDKSGVKFLVHERRGGYGGGESSEDEG